MVKRVFVVHGWGKTPEGDWFPWLKAELEKKGFEVHVPAMPNTNYPKIKPWVETLQKVVGTPDKETYFIGHSIGCQTILRYLESLPKTVKVGGVVFVAGWFSLTPAAMPDEESEEIAKPWIETPINLKIATQKTKNMIAIFSDNDPYVPFQENKIKYAQFCKEIIVEKGKGHIDVEAGITKLPSILKAVLEIAK
jgi:hypothetical protein